MWRCGEGVDVRCCERQVEEVDALTRCHVTLRSVARSDELLLQDVEEQKAFSS